MHTGNAVLQAPLLPPSPVPPHPPQEGSVFRGTFDFESEPFDWGEGYARPNIPLQDLVIAELPVRLFTGGLRSCTRAGAAPVGYS